MFNCVRSSILANSVEIFADVHICFVAENFYFLIFEKHNSKIAELSSRKLHSGTFHCPGIDLAGTRDISFHSGTVPGNPGHLVTLVTMGARRIFSRGVQTQRLVKDCRSYLSSVYLWNTKTCCRISLCRIASDNDSVSDSMHDYCSAKNQKSKSRGLQVHLLAPACGRPC